MDGIGNGQGESLAHCERGMTMYFVHNDFYDGGCHFDTLKEAVYHARWLQRLAYRAGVVSTTIIETEQARYNLGLHEEHYKTSVWYHKDISTRLSDILTRKSCRTFAQAVTLGAGINSGFVNPYKIRNLGKSTINELHAFSRQRVCDMRVSRKVYDNKYSLGYLLEG